MPGHVSLQHVEGRDIIHEHIREQCVYESLPADKKSYWFTYMSVLMDGCLGSNSSEAVNITQKCHD